MNHKEKVAAIRKAFAARKEKATDMDILVGHIMKLPYGQLKKVLSDEVLAVLHKYGCE